MNELINIQNNEAVTTSLQVAEKFHKRHDSVIRNIEKLINNSPQNCGQLFKVSEYVDTSGKSNKMYYINRDGFSLLVMGFNGKDALDWKLKYIQAFNQMESILSEKRTADWVETRRYGKLTRKAETDVIKQLVEYAKEQGSDHSDKLYITYSKLAKKIAGISDRDIATIRQLNNLELIERIILNEIENGMIAEIDYHVIYKNCKAKLELFKDITYMSTPLLREVV